VGVTPLVTRLPGLRGVQPSFTGQPVAEEDRRAEVEGPRDAYPYLLDRSRKPASQKDLWVRVPPAPLRPSDASASGGFLRMGSSRKTLEGGVTTRRFQARLA